MPLLGGAVKLAGNKVAGTPLFTSDPYAVVDITQFPSGPAAQARMEIRANGTVYAVRSGGTDFLLGRWDAGLFTLNKANYQFRLDLLSGGLTGGDAINSWIAANSGTDLWEVLVATTGIEDFTGTIRIRLGVSPFTEYDSASVSLYAERTQ